MLVEVVVGVAELRKGETETDRQTETEQRVRDTGEGGGDRQTESETEKMMVCTFCALRMYMAGSLSVYCWKKEQTNRKRGGGGGGGGVGGEGGDLKSSRCQSQYSAYTSPTAKSDPFL